MISDSRTSRRPWMKPVVIGGFPGFSRGTVLTLSAYATKKYRSFVGAIYTGGSIQLADLADHGVRYAGLTGVEWQGWLRAPEAGRYQLELDASTVSPNNFTNSTCIFAGWLEDHSIGVQETTPHSGLARPEPFTLVLGAELSPGLYKLRLWAVCTPSIGNQRVSVALLEKAPSDLNLRPVTGADLVHRQGTTRQAGFPE